MARKGTLQSVVALVTGAGQGIGRETAIRLAKEGAHVAVNGRIPHAKIEEVARATGGVSVIADIADVVQVNRMVREVEKKLGPIEVLVANAARMAMKPFLEHDPNEWWEQIRVNLSGHLNCIRAVLPGMQRLGRGRIVIISSNSGVIGFKNATGYAASKSGLNALGQSLARELTPRNIYVSVVAPGPVDTPQLMVDAADAKVSLEEIRTIHIRGIPAGRLGRPEEIAATVSFLASGGGPVFAGRIVQQNGGKNMCSP